MESLFGHALVVALSIPTATNSVATPPAPTTAKSANHPLGRSTRDCHLIFDLPQEIRSRRLLRILLDSFCSWHLSLLPSSGAL